MRGSFSQLQVFYCGSEKWEHCLSQAANYMQLLIDLTISNKTSTGSSSASEPIHQTRLDAAKNLLAQLIWFDMIAVISTGRGPFLNVSHLQLLESNIVSIGEISGCPDYVAKALCEVYLLKQWKTQAEDQQSLNIMDLAMRGAAIDRSLDGAIRELICQSPTEDTGGWASDKTANSRIEHQQRGTDLALVFANAGLIYLHTVMSGPNPQLQNVRSAVADMITPLKRLTDDKMLRYASWPLCVAASFADQKQLQLLHKMVVEGGNSKLRSLGTCRKALKLAQECRRIRIEDGEKCDWMSAMENQHEYLLLS